MSKTWRATDDLSVEVEVDENGVPSQVLARWPMKDTDEKTEAGKERNARALRAALLAVAEEVTDWLEFTSDWVPWILDRHAVVRGVRRVRISHANVLESPVTALHIDRNRLALAHERLEEKVSGLEDENAALKERVEELAESHGRDAGDIYDELRRASLIPDALPWSAQGTVLQTEWSDAFTRGRGS